jgi:hypothetical protein
MSNSIALEKAIKFALRIVGLYKYLTETKREFVLSKQILLSGTHIAKHEKSSLHSRAKNGFSMEMHKALERLWTLNSGCCCCTKVNSSAKDSTIH